VHIPVLIERIAGNGHGAKGGEPLALSAEGTTRDEALAGLRSLIAERLAVGAELISLDLDTRGTLRVPISGWSEVDELLDEWQKAIEEYRRKVGDDPDR
jgi:hypothetical protein